MSTPSDAAPDGGPTTSRTARVWPRRSGYRLMGQPTGHHQVDATDVTSVKAEAEKVLVHLRRCGIDARQVRPMPIPARAGAETSVVEFLSTLDQAAVARQCVLRLPEVSRVIPSGVCPSVLYVYYHLLGRP